MRKYAKKIIACMAMAVLLSAVFLTGCNTSLNNTVTDSKTDENSISQESDSFFAMDTYMTVTAYGDDESAKKAVSEARKEIERLDALLSTGKSDSEIGILNETGSYKVSEDTEVLIKKALDIYKSTSGAFNISIYPVMREWGFTDGSYKVPDKDTLMAALSKADISHVIVSDSVTLTDGCQIDLGGIAKGYASSKVCEIFKQCGIDSGMVNLGGNVQVLGGKIDGSNWRVAIENPLNDGTYLGIVSVKDKAVITSGGYERYFEENGVRYHHIIDPSDGMPADSGLTSVSIVSSDGTLADALSTSLFIMGEEEAVAYWKSSDLDFDFILYTEDGRLVASSGLKDAFTSEKSIQIVDK